MKFLLHPPQTIKSLNMTAGTDGWNRAGVFFTDRLGQVERSWKAILASMLYQLISQVIALQGMIVPYSLKEKSKSSHGNAFKNVFHKWDIESLQKALLFCKNQQIVHFKMCFFVDALDENNEGERHRRDVTEYLVQLATNPTDQGYGIIKICAASRPENDLSELLSSYNGIKLHEWTRPDIEAYVLDKLGQHTPMKAYTYSSNRIIQQRAKGLMEQIVHKARGVFLWVRLIVQDLRDSLTNGFALGIEDLEERLDQTPEELREFFALILKRISTNSRRDSYVMFECVLQARRPLTLLDLWLVLKSWKVSPSKEFFKRRIALNNDQIRSILDSGPALERRIQICSGGLLEVRLAMSSQLPGASNKGFSDEVSEYRQPKMRHPNDLTIDNSTFYALEEEVYSQPSNHQQGLDIHLCTVQVLHQTVKEFLAEPLILSSLLNREEEPSGYLATEDKTDYIFLFAYLFWLQILKEGRQKLLSSYGGIYAESFLISLATNADKLKAQFYVSTLDEIDNILSSEHHSNWCTDLFLKAEISEKYVDFLSVAVAKGLKNYVEQKLKDDPSLVSRHIGKPLLRFSVTPQVMDDRSLFVDTDMLESLLKSNADVEEVFEKHNALQSLVSAAPLLDKTNWQKAMSMLFKYGANPNCVSTGFSSVPVIFLPLLPGSFMIEHHSVIKCLVEHGANLDVFSKKYGRFIDVALRQLNLDLEATDWTWLFSHGLKIHSASVARLYSARYEDHALHDEICRNAAYYTPRARLKAAKFNPQWSFAEKYLNAPKK